MPVVPSGQCPLTTLPLTMTLPSTNLPDGLDFLGAVQRSPGGESPLRVLPALTRPLLFLIERIAIAHGVVFGGLNRKSHHRKHPDDERAQDQNRSEHARKTAPHNARRRSHFSYPLPFLQRREQVRSHH